MRLRVFILRCYIYLYRFFAIAIAVAVSLATFMCFCLSKDCYKYPEVTKKKKLQKYLPNEKVSNVF